MLVMKFGGSSILGGPHLRAVAEIVAAHRAARPVVVASATRDVTERLLAAANAAAAGERRLPRRTVLALEEEHADTIWSALDGRAARAEACRGVAGRLFRLDAALADVRASGRLTPEARDYVHRFRQFTQGLAETVEKPYREVFGDLDGLGRPLCRMDITLPKGGFPYTGMDLPPVVEREIRE